MTNPEHCSEKLGQIAKNLVEIIPDYISSTQKPAMFDEIFAFAAAAYKLKTLMEFTYVSRRYAEACVDILEDIKPVAEFSESLDDLIRLRSVFEQHIKTLETLESESYISRGPKSETRPFITSGVDHIDAGQLRDFGIRSTLTPGPVSHPQTDSQPREGQGDS